jgi:copper chaperone
LEGQGEFAATAKLDLAIMGRSILPMNEKRGARSAMLKLKVAGMTCGGCVASVERAVTAAAPGAKVSVDLKSGEVAIDGSIARQAIITAIEDAGYDVVGEAA